MEDQPTRRLSRRTVIIGVAGLAGVTAAGGAFIWLKVAGAPAQSGHPQTTALGATVTTPLLTYRGHQGPVTAVAWHDTRVASGSNDRTVQVWDATSGATLLTYRGHTAQVTALSWSPDGQRVVSGQGLLIGSKNSGTVHIWGAMTGTQLRTVVTVGESVTAPAPAPEPDVMVSHHPAPQSDSLCHRYLGLCSC